MGLGQMDSEAKFSKGGFIVFISLILCREIQGSSYRRAYSKGNGPVQSWDWQWLESRQPAQEAASRRGKRLFFRQWTDLGSTPALPLIPLGFIFLICNKKVVVFTLQDSSEI